ncbi:MAG: hypothetical protein KF862_16495 [Chitinophagaceae bacterium]|nr:hypothetical protein [Chitinophagaceae bacterium]
MKIKLSWIAFFICCAANVFSSDSTIHINRWTPKPMKVQGLNECIIDLGGEWLFNPAPRQGFESMKDKDASWKKIQVPGEWMMQGFKVEKNRWAGYQKTFTTPAQWSGRRIKLKCYAIYSESEIYINGEKAGYHIGGFTPFEYDVTKFVKPGAKSLITIKVKNESVADGLASGSRYAVHPLGGITRKIELIAVPDVNISQFHVSTIFDKGFTDAVMKAEVELANETESNVKDVSLVFELSNFKTGAVVFNKVIKIDEAFAGETVMKKIFEFPVAKPLKWDTEHPNLYLVNLKLETRKQSVTVQRRFGFRQIEVKGNQVFVNNYPIKLRGVCRHEVMPLRGRSVNGDQWAEDVKIFREGNVNYIRTSHYPPAEELVYACDSLGIFLEVEAPFCWAHETSVPSRDSVSVLQAQTLDMVNFFKSSPSVLMWSMGNESFKYKEYFSSVADMVKIVDPSRPRIFSQWSPDGDDNKLEIGNHHYPGPEGPGKYASSKRPMVFDEYVHINAYNRFELVTDPGIRDAWGTGFAAMWDRMYYTPSILGGAIWAGIDDSFFMPDSSIVGYGTWGVIDGWRRLKPEYWGMKKTYSPVRVRQTGNLANDTIGFIIENRHNFSNLDECIFRWTAGNHKGEIKAAAAPGGNFQGFIKLDGTIKNADTLYMDVYDPRNVLVDQYAFVLLPAVNNKKSLNTHNSKVQYVYSGTIIKATLDACTVSLDKSNGNLIITSSGNKEAIISSGQLLLLPLNSEGRGIQMTGTSQTFAPFTHTAANRVIKQVDVSADADAFSFRINDSYDEASGYVDYIISGNGSIEVAYSYLIRKDINPRQWGIVFNTADAFNTLRWKRNGFWNYYPADQIGRLNGTAEAFSSAEVSGAAGPGDKPSLSWAKDRNELGTNDFRSTKMNITEAKLSGAGNQIEIVSDGMQHLRTWKEKSITKLLIAEYSNLGGEGYFRGHAAAFDKPLKRGDIIKGKTHIIIQ